MVRHIAQLAEWQATKVFDYSGSGQSAEPRFQKGECAIFIGSSGTRDDIKANSKFEVGYGMIPYRPESRRRPAKLHHRRRHAMGAARSAARRICRRRKILRLSVEAGSAGRLAPEHGLPADHPRRLRPHPRAGLFTTATPVPAIGIEQLTLKPPTENSKGFRLGSFVLIRGVIEEELRAGVQRQDSPPRRRSTPPPSRGNHLLRQFERLF